MNFTFHFIYGMSSFPFDELHHFSRWLKRTTNQLSIFISPDEASFQTPLLIQGVPECLIERCLGDVGDVGFVFFFFHPIFIERFTGNIVRFLLPGLVNELTLNELERSTML